MVSKIAVLLVAAGCWACGRPEVETAGRNSSVFDSIVSQPELTLVFSGDIMQHMPQVDAAREADGSYDYHACFQYIKPFWEKADFAIANLETTLSEQGPYSGYPRFASPTSLAGALQDAGVDVVVLANNHCCDRGAVGIRTTVRTVDSLGLLYAGVYTDSAQASKPLIMNKGRYRVALLNATYGTNGLPVPKGTVVHQLDTLRMAGEVRQAKRDSATHIILFAHWGEEYQQRPNRAQRKLAEWCRRQGIDVVIGSHPHVAQPIDTAVNVVWSLGNFVSNQRNRYQDGGLNVRVTLSMMRRPVIESLPHWVWTPVQEGRKRYYVLPAYVSGQEMGMDSLTNELFVRALNDSRVVAGEVGEVVL